MHDIALASGRLAELLRQSLNDARVEAPTPRQRVAQALLAAGVDHAVSLNLLLSRPSPSAAFSAVGLFRLQLDALSRGIFFARPEFSSDEEVADFMLNDRMPLVKPLNQKKRQIRLDELIARLRDFVATVSPDLASEGLHLRFSYALDAFNGFVHGGKDVVESYQEHSKFGLIFHPDFNTLANISLQAPDGHRIEGRTYKLVRANTGEPRDFPAPQIAVLAAHQQRRLARILKAMTCPNDPGSLGNHLWVQTKTYKSARRGERPTQLARMTGKSCSARTGRPL